MEPRSIEWLEAEINRLDDEIAGRRALKLELANERRDAIAKRNADMRAGVVASGELPKASGR